MKTLSSKSKVKVLSLQEVEEVGGGERFDMVPQAWSTFSVKCDTVATNEWSTLSMGCK
jgi:hypothetical protein